AEDVIDLSLRFPEDLSYTAEHRAAVVRDLRGRLTALPGVTAITSARAPNDNLGRRARVSLNGAEPSSANTRGTVYYTWVQPNYFETLGVAISRGRDFRV